MLECRAEDGNDSETLMMNPHSSFIATPRGALLGCSVVVAVALTLDVLIAPVGSIIREGGPVELCSAGFFLLALMALCARSPVARAWPGMVLLLAMFLRELDADKRFTHEGLLSSKVFVYDTPVWQKLLAASVLAILLVSVGALIRRGAAPLFQALVARRTWALYFATAVLLAVLSKSIDGLGRKLAPFGLRVPDAVNLRAGQIEEVMELGIPVLLLMAILAKRPARTG